MLIKSKDMNYMGLSLASLVGSSTESNMSPPGAIKLVATLTSPDSQNNSLVVKLPDLTDTNTGCLAKLEYHINRIIYIYISYI